MEQVSPRNEPGAEMPVELLGFSVVESDTVSVTFFDPIRPLSGNRTWTDFNRTIVFLSCLG